MLNLKGKLQSIHIDYASKKPIVTFLLENDCLGIENLKDSLLDIKVKKHKETRSLDSNAYFHLLVDKLADKLGLGRTYLKNRLISDYGQIQYVEDGVPFIYKTNAPPDAIHNLEYIHLWLIKIGEDKAYWYKGYRGSHTYNTTEMARLIRGTIEECKEQGIETATPEELERMQKLWKERYERST